MRIFKFSSWLVITILLLVFAPLALANETDVDKLIELFVTKGVVSREEATAFRAGLAISKQDEKQPSLVEATEKGFLLKSADGDFQLKLRGYLQADGRFFIGDDGKANATPATDQFLLRRARLIFEGTLHRNFDFRLAPDFGGGKAELQEAYVDIHYFPEFKFRAGKLKTPVGLERLQSSTETLFVEQALPSNLTPNQDVGLQAHGDLADGVLSYAVGIFNGVPDGGSADTDTNDNKEFDGRIFLTPFKSSKVEALKGLGFGVAGTFANVKGDLKAPNLPTFKTQGQEKFFSYLSSSSPTLENTVIAAGEHTRISPQGYYYLGAFGLLGEYVISPQEVSLNGNKKTIRNDAWQVAASYVVTGEKTSYKGVTPTNSWGALEIATRYGELNIDEDAFPTFADPKKSAKEAKSVGIGLNWHINKNVKVTVDYEQTKFKGGGGGVDREDEKVFLSRLQTSF